MKVTLTERFIEEADRLTDLQKGQLFSVLLKLPSAVRNWHQHAGIGLRKIHPSGIFEARLGLGLRMVFGYERDSLILHRLGSHEEIQRFLKGL